MYGHKHVFHRQESPSKYIVKGERVCRMWHIMSWCSDIPQVQSGATVEPWLTWHFLYHGTDPRSGCISGYSWTCICNWILPKPWCFNFSRNFWFLTIAFVMARNFRLNIFLVWDYDIPYIVNKTKQPPCNSFVIQEKKFRSKTSQTMWPFSWSKPNQGNAKFFDNILVSKLFSHLW